MPRLDVLKCDGCHRQQAEASAVDWYEVSRAGIDVLRFGDHPGPWLFCSPSCIRRWVSTLDGEPIELPDDDPRCPKCGTFDITGREPGEVCPPCRRNEAAQDRAHGDGGS